jgi:hypothetical protein
MTPRQNIQEAWEESLGYDDEISVEEKLRTDIRMGLDIKEMMETRGWSNWFQPMCDKLMEELKSIEGIETLKELQGRQQTYSALKLLFGSIDGLVDVANRATVQLDQKDTDIPV